MTARELFEAIGLVDEELIADADAPARRRWTPRLVLRRALPLAACLCVAAGAVIAWRIAPWQGMTGSSIQSEAAAAPDLAAAPEQAGAGEDGSEAAPEIAESENSTADRTREETSPVLDAIAPSEANGGGPSLAISAEELLGDTANPEPVDLPETLPVYRNPLADGGLDESGMRDTLRQVLQAMGRDPDLADDAVLVYNWSQDQIDQADQIAADLQQQFGSASVLEFWGGMAQLELALDDGSSLTVRNSRKVYLSAAENTSLRAMTGNDLTANASLLQGLGGFDTLRSPVSHSWSDGSALNDGPVLTRSGAPGSMTGLQTGQDGSLAAWTLSAATSATPVAELPRQRIFCKTAVTWASDMKKKNRRRARSWTPGWGIFPARRCIMCRCGSLRWIWGSRTLSIPLPTRTPAKHCTPISHTTSRPLTWTRWPISSPPTRRADAGSTKQNQPQGAADPKTGAAPCGCVFALQGPVCGGRYRHSFSQVLMSMVTPGSTSTGAVPAGRKPRFLQNASACRSRAHTGMNRRVRPSPSARRWA